MQYVVTTDAVVWIEIPLAPQAFVNLPVTTDAVVWIEIVILLDTHYLVQSPLMQWCGLKYVKHGLDFFIFGHH